MELMEDEVKLLDTIQVTGLVTITIRDVVTGDVTVHQYHNIFTTAGRIAICRRLMNVGTYANEGIITYGAVGTSASTPALGDTQLGAEIYRKTILTSTRDSSSVTFTLYYGTTEAIGSLREFGLFGEAATATANSGTLFNRVSINEEKTGSNTLTIDSVISFA